MKGSALLLVGGLLEVSKTVAQSVVIIRIPTGPCVPGNTALSSLPNGDSESTSSTDTTLITSSSSSYVPIATQTGFLITYRNADSPRYRLARRQEASYSYITSSGESTNNCHESSIAHLDVDGQLITSTGAVYSTALGIVSQDFVPSKPTGPLSTTWQLSDGVLKWNNINFQNGSALLCSIGGSIKAYFRARPPLICRPIAISTLPLSICPGIEAQNGSLSSAFSQSSPTSNSSFPTISQTTPTTNATSPIIANPSIFSSLSSSTSSITNSITFLPASFLNSSTTSIPFTNITSTSSTSSDAAFFTKSYSNSTTPTTNSPPAFTNTSISFPAPSIPFSSTTSAPTTSPASLTNSPTSPIVSDSSTASDASSTVSEGSAAMSSTSDTSTPSSAVTDSDAAATSSSPGAESTTSPPDDSTITSTPTADSEQSTSTSESTDPTEGEETSTTAAANSTPPPDASAFAPTTTDTGGDSTTGLIEPTETSTSADGFASAARFLNTGVPEPV